MNKNNREIGPCAGLAGKLFGHKFKTRYDEHSTAPPDIAAKIAPVLAQHAQQTGLVLEGSDHALESIILAMGSEATVYCCDVCVRCGQVIKRPDPLQSFKSEDSLRYNR